MTQDRRKDENRPTEPLVFTDAALIATGLAHLEAEKAAACLVHAKDDVWVGVGTKDALRGLLREDTASQSQAVPSELASLKELALAATPGPWTYHPMGETTDPEIAAANGSRVAALVAADMTKQNSRFIAAANPATILKLIEQVESLSHSAATGKVPEDFVLMPKRLTAENGAKSAFMGEYSESVRVTCHECDGSGEMFGGFECDQCDGEGHLEQRVTVEWDTIKRIYARAVELLASPAAPLAGKAEPLPKGWEALSIVYNEDMVHPEEVAYGPPVMMRRLGKWLDKFMAQEIAMRDGMVLAPRFRGYALLGIGAYIINHSRKGEDAELVISVATDEQKAGRTVGDLRDNAPDAVVQPETMAVRLRFENVAGLDALERQLRLLRAEHFSAPLAAAVPAEEASDVRRDAARYRYLRNNCNDRSGCFETMFGQSILKTGNNLDAAIDGSSDFAPAEPAPIQASALTDAALNLQKADAVLASVPKRALGSAQHIDKAHQYQLASRDLIAAALAARLSKPTAQGTADDKPPMFVKVPIEQAERYDILFRAIGSAVTVQGDALAISVAKFDSRIDEFGYKVIGPKVGQSYDHYIAAQAPAGRDADALLDKAARIARKYIGCDHIAAQILELKSHAAEQTSGGAK